MPSYISWIKFYLNLFNVKNLHNSLQDPYIESSQNSLANSINSLQTPLQNPSIPLQNPFNLFKAEFFNELFLLLVSLLMIAKCKSIGMLPKQLLEALVDL